MLIPSLIPIFSEITPKSYAAHNPVKLSMIFVRPIRFFILVLFQVDEFGNMGTHICRRKDEKTPH